ncbi:MAG: aspartate/glutamate racemase family protein [Hyphomonadaceae bacterium]
MRAMKTLGLIGGMSWESTTHYYRELNRLVRARVGGKHSAPLILWSVDFAPVALMQEEDRWDELAAQLAEAARRLEQAGAEAILICANTMHRMADEVAAAVSVPLIHIAEVTADAIKRAGVKRPLLMATRYTMEQSFYRERLAKNGVEALIPGDADRARLHDMIFNELIHGVFSDAARAEFLAILEKERGARGVDGVILGCTEFGMLAPPSVVPIPAFDTAALHAAAGIDYALSEGEHA